MIKHIPKIYLSGGFGSNWQKKLVDELGEVSTMFNPKENRLANPEEYLCWDLHFIKQCDLIFAYMESTNPSGLGLSFEIGYGLALNKTIILVDEKSQSNHEFKRSFGIVRHSSLVCFESLDEGVLYLKRFLEGS